jgi:pantoate kinase
VDSDGTILQQHGGVTETRKHPGGAGYGNEYCLHVPGGVHIAVATGDNNSDTFDVIANPGTVANYVAVGNCAVGTSVVVWDENDGQDAFYIEFN